MNSSSFKLLEANVLHPMVNDFILKELNTTFKNPNTLDDLEETANKCSFSIELRQNLVEALTESYKDCGLFEKVKDTIKELQDSNSYTITTGHQLCLFTGPLYFILKIASAINLANQLNQFSEVNRYVPIYWMASEDHDFEEIKSIFLFNKSLSWETFQSGATGRFKIDDSFLEFFNLIKSLFQNDEQTLTFVQKLGDCYLSSENLAIATTKMVHLLFPDSNLLVLNADSILLKKAFIPILKSEIHSGLSYSALKKKNEELSSKFKLPVQGREINLFYLKDNERNRIIPLPDNMYQLSNQLLLNKTELFELIDTNPEYFSPNVVLRPVYQEVILPNIAYIGGRNEIAYWLQLEEVFNAFKVQKPCLLVRNSVLLLSNKVSSELEKLNIKIEELLTSTRKDVDLKTLFYLKNEVIYAIDKFLNTQLNEFKDIKEVIKDLPSNFAGNVVKQSNEIQGLLKKMSKEVKEAKESANNQKIDKLLKITSILFPDNALAERRDNILNYSNWIKNGLMDFLVTNANPLNKDILIITE